MKSNRTTPGGASAVSNAGDLLAKSLAVAITFFGTGPAFTASQRTVSEFTTNSYGSELVTVAGYLWFTLLAVVFYALATLLIAAFVKIGSFKGAKSLSKTFINPINFSKF